MQAHELKVSGQFGCKEHWTPANALWFKADARLSTTNNAIAATERALAVKQSILLPRCATLAVLSAACNDGSGENFRRTGQLGYWK